MVVVVVVVVVPNLETSTFGGSNLRLLGVQTLKLQRLGVKPGLGSPNLGTSTFGGSKP